MSLHDAVHLALPFATATLSYLLSPHMPITTLLLLYLACTAVTIALAIWRLYTPRTLLHLDGMAISHYVEKTRWLLDLSGESYAEHTSIPVLGILLFGRTLPRLRYGRTSVNDSSDIFAFVAAKAAGAQATLDADTVRARFDWRADAHVLERLDMLDTQLGPHIRRFAYTHLVRQRPDVCSRLWAQGLRGWQAWAYHKLRLYPVCEAVLKRLLKLNVAGAERSRARVDAVFEEVSQVLAQDGRRFLCGGDRPTVADVAFAALAGPAVLPEGYRGAKPSLDELPEVLRTAVLKWRKTRAGKHVQFMYKNFRDV